MHFLSGFSSDYSTKMLIISYAIILVSHIFFAAALHYDTRLNHIKHGNLWTSAAFFIGWIPVAIYYIVRKKLPEQVPIVCTNCGRKALKNRTKCPHCGGTHFGPLQYENRGAVQNRIIVLLAVAIVLFAFNEWYMNYSPWAPGENEVAEDLLDEFTDTEEASLYGYEVNGKTVYYDREGNAYTDMYEVPYYTEDGVQYTYDSLEGYVSAENSISANAALVDSNGYLVDAYAKFETVPDTVPFRTTDGVTYYAADTVSWNADGQMVYSTNGEVIQ